MLLLAGCSFVNDPDCHLTGFGSLAHDYHSCRIVSRSGAGNAYIASSILDNLTNDITEVFVLWSGLSRIDLALPKCRVDSIGNFSHKNLEQHELWIHSGGWGGSWTIEQKKLPSWLCQYLENMYHPQDWNMINRRSLQCVIGCLNTLEARNIPYRWNFIYDIFQDYSNNSSLGPAMEPNDPLVQLIPPDSRLTSTPYEFCKHRNLLKPDNFHPTQTGWQEWFNSLDDWRPDI